MTPAIMLNNFVEKINQFMESNYKVTKRSRFSETVSLELSYQILTLVEGDRSEEKVVHLEETIQREVGRIAKEANLITDSLVVSIESDSFRVKIKIVVSGTVVDVGFSQRMIEFGTIDNALCYSIKGHDHDINFPTLESYIAWEAKKEQQAS